VFAVLIITGFFEVFFIFRAYLFGI